MDLVQEGSSEVEVERRQNWQCNRKVTEETNNEILRVPPLATVTLGDALVEKVNYSEMLYMSYISL